MKIYRKKILDELQRIERDGMKEVISYLTDSDFFTAPASSMYHLAQECGLIKHSWHVYKALEGCICRWGMENTYGRDTSRICGLLHDVCKIGQYKKESKWKKEDGKWVERKVWVKDESEYPLGHGEKSVIILQKMLELSKEEVLAIRWHMGPWTPGIIGGEFQKAYNEAQKSPLVVALYLADMEAMVTERY